MRRTQASPLPRQPATTLTTLGSMTVRSVLKRIPFAVWCVRLAKFVVFRARLAWVSWRDRGIPAAVAGRYPLPPARLRHRVHGELDAQSFLRTGAIVAGNIGDLVASTGARVADFARILDFGCGCGRVLRHFGALDGEHRISATDIDPEAIAWCQANMPGIDWRTNAFLPPTEWPDATFDFLFSISVFTHLDEAMQRAWLRELQRITRPGGLLLLTVHGDFVHCTLPDEQRRALGASGFFFATGATGRLKLDGLPDFYQGAYHTREYIDREWGRYFTVLSVVPRGINDHQDAVLLRRL